MTERSPDEELDNVLAEEAARRWAEEHGVDEAPALQIAALAAKLTREGWGPEGPVGPGMTDWREAEIARLAEAAAAVTFDLPGGGGLRGRLVLGPAQAREIVRTLLQALRGMDADEIAEAIHADAESRSPVGEFRAVIDALLGDV